MDKYAIFGAGFVCGVIFLLIMLAFLIAAANRQ